MYHIFSLLSKSSIVRTAPHLTFSHLEEKPGIPPCSAQKSSTLPKHWAGGCSMVYPPGALLTGTWHISSLLPLKECHDEEPQADMIFYFFASAYLGQIPRSRMAGPVRKMLEVARVPHKASHQRCMGRPVLLSLDHGTYCQPFGVKSTPCIFAFPVTRSLNMHNAGYSLSRASRTFQAHDEYHSIPVFKDAPMLADLLTLEQPTDWI